MKDVRLTVGGLTDTGRQEARTAVETRFVVRSQQNP